VVICVVLVFDVGKSTDFKEMIVVVLTTSACSDGDDDDWAGDAWFGGAFSGIGTWQPTRYVLGMAPTISTLNQEGRNVIHLFQFS